MDGHTTLLEKAAAAERDFAAVRARAGTAKAQPLPADSSGSVPLYADRVRVYPKAVHGAYRRIKWAVLGFCLTLYYLAPWLRWDRGPGAPDQALLIDMTAPRAFFFDIEIWPQEVYFITGLLVLGALGLFLVTSLFGRLWCGYACPQTVWTDLFMWVERLIEGDRAKRMRLDQGPLTVQKVAKKIAKHSAWLLIALATGGAWALYFNDAPTFVADFFTGGASVEQYFFVGLFTSTTYLLAGWAREQVCTYMCPWPRFQASMLDKDSLVVTYEDWRGERRGKTKAGAPPVGFGDCVDCRQCFAACPMGIDIRDGQQMECIGCGLCIDACDEIMDRMQRPRGLIQFDTLANQEAKAKSLPPRFRFVRPRTVIYAALVAAVAGIMLAALVLRTTVEVSVLRDRAPLFVTLSDGSIRNGYTLRVLNKKREDVAFDLSLDGLPGATLVVQDVGEAADGRAVVLHTRPDTAETYRVFISLPHGAAEEENTSFDFILRDPVSGDGDIYEAVFMGPHKPRPHRY